MIKPFDMRFWRALEATSRTKPRLCFKLALRNPILKSVLASGCTAVSLAKRSLEIYQPCNLIIASVFYSVNGLNEIFNELPSAEMCIFGEADEIDSKGMLIPGMGDLDGRISK
jgi:uracil phosphoribosyltransferase